MNYPGNASLPAAVKDRVVTTFRQSVALLKAGRMDEVSAGCNLVLQMDPTFEPARRLLEKARNPSAPIDVDSLLPEESPALEQARQAMEERDFQRVIHLTTEILTNDLMNDEARILGDEAREKMEAAPFVDQFTRRCEENLAAGKTAAARADLEKARSLDAAHPDVARLTAAITAREASAASAPAASFVVDGTPAPPRGTAQAADFGFTFEEDKPADAPFSSFSFETPARSEGGFGGFSFDPAPPAGSTPPAGEFDFSTASVATNPEDQKKIERYLEDGDRASERGDWQEAIDIWSRIFLIDVTNEMASERIERAKAKRRQVETAIEPLLTEGIDAFDRNDTARAHTAFTEILRIDPGNVMAEDYLARLGETVSGPASRMEIPPPSVPEQKLDLDFLETETGRLSEEPLVPPSPAPPSAKAAAPKQSKPKTAKASGRKLPLGAIAAVLGLLVLGAGGWFVWNRFMSRPEADPAAAQAILTRASALANSGKYDQAIALLQDIQPGDPQHDKALVMIADLQQKKSSSAQVIDGMPAAAYFEQRVAAARAAYDAHDYAAAKAAFDQALRVQALPPDAKAQYDMAAQQVAKLDAAKALFTERKYSEAISNLEPLLAQDPQNLNIRRLMVDAHFNLGAIALQEERIPDAIREFDQVLAMSPDDELAKRSRALAQRYHDANRDLLYKIYVKYLPLRQAL